MSQIVLLFLLSGNLCSSQSLNQESPHRLSDSSSPYVETELVEDSVSTDEVTKKEDSVSTDEVTKKTEDKIIQKAVRSKMKSLNSLQEKATENIESPPTLSESINSAEKQKKSLQRKLAEEYNFTLGTPIDKDTSKHTQDIEFGDVSLKVSDRPEETLLKKHKSSNKRNYFIIKSKREVSSKKH